MPLYKTTVPIKGMHCRSCELLVQDELGSIKGINKVDVSFKNGSATLYHQRTSIDQRNIKSAVERAGYAIGSTSRKPLFSHNIDDYIAILYSLLGIGAVILLFTIFGFESLLTISSGKPSGLFAVFLIGLTAGVSTCMALVGGLVLGASAQFAEKNPNAGRVARFLPHVVFNIGRIISYAILGGVIGVLGSIFQISGMGLGLVTIGVALVMLLLGIQLTDIMPRLEDVKLTLPARLTRVLGIKTRVEGEYSSLSAFLMGAGTFFLPCGFTQAMQLYAMSTGNFMAGFLIMGTFALGTTPGLLSIGGLTLILKGELAHYFYTFAGVVVVLLALFNFRNGVYLTGLTSDFLTTPPKVLESQKPAEIEMEGNKQVIRMTQTGSGYEPKVFNIRKGIPVKWIITSKDSYSCAASILANKIGVQAPLNPGDNVFEFTATETGSIPFSCSMGMYRGVINVIN